MVVGDDGMIVDGSGDWFWRLRWQRDCGLVLERAWWLVEESQELALQSVQYLVPSMSCCSFDDLLGSHGSRPQWRCFVSL